ncbi:19130_t:CDS:2, partial [Racocetra persica]
SLNCIFLLDENLSTGIPEMIGLASLKAIFENIRSEYTPYHLSDKDVIRYHEISKIANKNFQGCKLLLRKWQKEVEENDDDLVLEVFESV